MKQDTLEGRAKTKNGVIRLCFSVLCILLEAAFIIIVITRLNEYAEIVNLLTRVFAGILVLALYASDQTSSMKMPWIILILVFPIMGVAMYLLIGLNGGTHKMRERYADIDRKLLPLLPDNREKLENIKNKIPKAGNISEYIWKNAGYPVYQNTDIVYYDEAVKGLEAQLSALSKAEKFIFMEYHAIEDAEAWKKIQKVLEERVQAGVEVRVFYDDMGSIGFINTDFVKKMEQIGIHCRVFNPFMPGLNVFLNNRDHRKITVIDGKVAFTGGYNLANEYFNYTNPYGQWKDTGIRLEGDAVQSLTATFLEMWNAANDRNNNEECISSSGTAFHEIVCRIIVRKRCRFMCTAATYQTKDFYMGRTLDYEFSYGEEVTITPRNYEFDFRYAGKAKTHYALIGMAFVAGDYPLYYDAANEKGLGMAGLNFVGNAAYADEATEADKDLVQVAQYEFIPWILTQCASVAEARRMLSNMKLMGTPFSEQLPTAQLHWMIADKEECIVVESMKDGMHIYDDPVGVLTNNPPFPGQMFALNNYAGVSRKQPESTFAGVLELDPYSRGMGGMGIPGDLSSQSRFVKVAFTKLNAISGDGENESVSQFFHILGSVDQQRGCCEVSEGAYEITIYTSCCNTTKGIYYYTTYDNHQITAVDMYAENLDSDKLIRYPIILNGEIRWHNK